MMQHILKLAAGFNIATAAFIWVMPMRFYDGVPGVAETGPFNDHFLRDVGLAYLVSGLALAFAVRRQLGVLALFGVAWPMLHAVFHLWIWAVMRGGALDQVALANLMGIQLPAWMAFGAAVTLGRQEATA